MDLHGIKVDAVTVRFFLIVLGWVTLAQVGEELEVHEPQECAVELEEGAHHLVINVEGQALIELVGSNPGNWLTHDLNLIIDSLN